MGEAMTAPEREGLKPCPFCGGEALVDDNEPYPGDCIWFDVGCGECNCVIDACFDTEADAIAAWNRRAAPTTEEE